MAPLRRVKPLPYTPGTASWKVMEGDAREALAVLPERSVQTVITSPPYFGLRDYGTAEWEGGDANHEHDRVAARNGRGGSGTLDKRSANAMPSTVPVSVCSCGATRKDLQIGLEPTPDEFVTALVEVFREVRRVLRDDGTVWLNLGDSYAGAGYANRDLERHYGPDARNGGKPKHCSVAALPGVKAKDLIGVPWMVAFALRADGWYLRSDIIWHKPNPMPESVTDRPTKAHEYVFLLAKGGKWKARVVECADLPSERLHLGADLSAKRPDLVAGDFSVRLATAVLDCAKSHDALGLRTLDPQVGEQSGARESSPLVRDLPVEHWAPVLASRLLRAEITPKEFLCELHRRGVALADGDQLLIGDGLPLVPLPPGVARYGEGTIAVHHPGEVREFDLRHNRIVLSTPPTSCSYFYDADAIREEDGGKASGNGFVGRQGGSARYGEALADLGSIGTVEQWVPGSGRNKRSVWTVATKPYKGAHFATFPPKLIEPMIKAGTPEKCCGVCGAPWKRVVERGESVHARVQRETGITWQEQAEMSRLEGKALKAGAPSVGGVRLPDGRHVGSLTPGASVMRGWESTCEHDDDAGRSVVLDPFAGAGTTGVVALRNGRSFIGVELNPEYVRLARERIIDDMPLLNSASEAA